MKKGQENTFTIVAVFIIIFGMTSTIVIYQNLQIESSARIKYEYNTLKSYLNLPDDVLNKLVSGGRVTGNLKYIEGLEFEGKTLFKVRNVGDIPLTGFNVTFNEFTILPEIVPYMLPPNFDGVVIVNNQKINSSGRLTISTDQGAAVQITKHA